MKFYRHLNYNLGTGVITACTLAAHKQVTMDDYDILYLEQMAEALALRRQHLSRPDIVELAEQDIKAAWTSIGQYLRQALQEFALATGGADLWEEINQLDEPDAILPPVAMLQLLLQHNPHLRHSFMPRVSQIQQASLG